MIADMKKETLHLKMKVQQMEFFQAEKVNKMNTSVLNNPGENTSEDIANEDEKGPNDSDTEIVTMDDDNKSAGSIEIKNDNNSAGSVEIKNKSNSNSFSSH